MILVRSRQRTETEMTKTDRKKIITGLISLAVFVLLILISKTEFFKSVINAAKPLIYAVITAYVLWPLIDLIENRWIGRRLERKGPRKKLLRIISMIITYIVFLVVISFIVYGIVPQLASSIQVLGGKINGFINNADEYVNKLPDFGNEFLNQYKNNISEYFAQVLGWVWGVLRGSITNITAYIVNVVTEVKNVLFGLFFSIYFVLYKESIFAQISKFAHSLVPDSIYGKARHYVQVVDNSFGGFLKGKLLDSVIIGTLCAIAMAILRMPYVVLISIIVLITNMIPVIGPLIGAIPSALILLIVEPRQTIPFLILILVIQQLDGNVIGPKILSGFTCLNPLWVIIAVTIMGGLLGTFGMFLGVPTFAVIYSIVKELVEARLVSRSMPVDTLAYYKDPEYIPIVNSKVLKAKAAEADAKALADEASSDALDG